jgi:HK97 family phage prohead protease
MDLITGMREEKTLGLSRVQTKQDDAGLITELTGYCAAFNNVDSGGDIILPGAFTQTIAERVAAGKVKLLADHVWDTDHVMGTVLEASEDDYGLLFRSDIDADPDVQRRAGKVKRGTVTGLSIGYEAMEALAPTPEQQQRGAMRILSGIKWLEGSVTPFPMNEGAQVIGAKDASAVSREVAQAMSLLTAAMKHGKAGRRNSSADEQRISTALSLLQELLDSVSHDDTSDDDAPDGKTTSTRLIIAQGMQAAHRARQLATTS